jgi:transcriptional regulator with XRE-family HTH domain
MVSSIHTVAYQKIVKRLRKARLLVDLSQKDAAAKLGRSQAWLSKCESGERRVDALELYQFGKLYGVSITWFFKDQ